MNHHHSRRRHRRHGKSHRNAQHHLHSQREALEQEYFNSSHLRPESDSLRIEDHTANEAKYDHGIIEDWLDKINQRDLASCDNLGAQHQQQRQLISRSISSRQYGSIVQDDSFQGHKRPWSRDSSIIVDTPRNVTRQSVVPKNYSQPEQDHHHFLNPKRSVRSPLSAGILSPNYSKHARRKTREDRYDPNKQSREKERKRRETSEPLAHGSKRTLPYRQDVMDSFRSEAILQDRLTLQPCIIPGLFQNGRASSPKRVEELAFNSIAVRENPQSRQSLRHQHNRSQGRKLQRGERVANEVQTFVGRPKTSTNEVLELPPYQLHDIYVDWRSRQQHDFGSYDERYDKEREPIGPPERTYGEQAKEQGHLRNEYSSLSPFQRPSSNETTNYSSWSMNNNEELSVSHQPGLRHSSDTPEPIRKSMRETGVFDGTGITGKDRNSRTEAFAVDKLFRHTDDLLERGRYATQEHNSRPHITIVQQPAIFHYRDKGTMATAEPLAMSQTQFSTKAVTKLEHGDVVNCTTKLSSPGTHMESHGLLPSDVIRQTTDRSVQVESGIFSSQCEDYTRNQVYITEQERSNPQRREISTQTSPKANVQTQAQTPESTKNAFLNNMNMRSAIANASKLSESRIEDPINTKDSREVAAKCRSGLQSKPASFETVASNLNTTICKSTSRFGDIADPTDCQPPFPTENQAYTYRTNQPHTNTRGGRDKISNFTGPQLTTQLPCRNQSYHERIGFNPDYTQQIEVPQICNDKYMVDFTTHNDGDVLGKDHRGYIRKQYFDKVSYRLPQEKDHANEPLGIYDWMQQPGHELSVCQKRLGRTGLLYRKTANLDHRKAEQSSSTVSRMQPDGSTKQVWDIQPTGASKFDEQDIMHQFWRPNLY